MQQSTASLYFTWRTTSLCVGGRAASRSCLPGLRSGGGGRQAGTTVLPAPLDTPTHNALVGRSGRLNSHHHTRHDKTVLSVSCLVSPCELDDCCERVQTSNFLSATVLSCRESNSHRRIGRDTDKTVLSCLAWRCELALRPQCVRVMCS